MERMQVANIEASEAAPFIAAINEARAVLFMAQNGIPYGNFYWKVFYCSLPRNMLRYHDACSGGSADSFMTLQGSGERVHRRYLCILAQREWEKTSLFLKSRGTLIFCSVFTWYFCYGLCGLDVHVGLRKQANLCKEVRSCLVLRCRCRLKSSY